MWGIAVIFVKSQFSSKSLCSWVLTIVCICIDCVACMYSLYTILLRIGGSVIEEVPDWEQYMFAGQTVTFLPSVSKGGGGEGNLFWWPFNLTGTRHSTLSNVSECVCVCVYIYIYIYICCAVAAPWLRWLVADQSPRSPGFAPDSTHMGFVVDKVALGQIFLRVLRVFSCQYHSTVVIHTHISSRGWTVCPFLAAVQRRSFTPSIKSKKTRLCSSFGNIGRSPHTCNRPCSARPSWLGSKLAPWIWLHLILTAIRR
jgi:hypothetical protein